MKHLLIYLFAHCVGLCFSQNDTIILTNGRALPLKIVEISDSIIKYKRVDNQRSDSNQLNRKKIALIKFANNTQLRFNQIIIDSTFLKKKRKFTNAFEFNLLGLTRSEYDIDFEHKIKKGITIGGCLGVTYGKDYYNQLLQFLGETAQTGLFYEDRNEFLLGSNKYKPGFVIGFSPKFYFSDEVMKGAYVGLNLKSALRRYSYDAGYQLKKFKYITYDTGSASVTYYGLPVFIEKQTGLVANTSLSFIMGSQFGGKKMFYNNISFELGYNLLSYNKPIYIGSSNGRAYVSLSKIKSRNINLYFFINYSIGIRY